VTAAPPASTPSPARIETPAAAPHLVLSGIAFYAERDARLAVVNDLPVMEGTVIEGAVVEEILADRVRFSREGRAFEVVLQK
jgi:general secretion pathway protein B